MNLRLFGGVIFVCLQAPAADAPEAKMLLLEPGATLASPCQTFHWRAPRPDAQVRLTVGSCQNCTDISDLEYSGVYAAIVTLPSDGREIHASLTTRIGSSVIGQENYFYRAGVTGTGDGKCEEEGPTSVGVYHWAGKAAQSLSQGADAVTELGGSSIRLSLSPRMRRDYNVDDSCIAGFRLDSSLHDPDVRYALSHARLRTVMLTVYDGASFNDCDRPEYLSEAFFTPENRARVVSEYADFTYELIRMHSGSGKTFILANWESDNAVYCGSSYRYVTDPEFRSGCDRDYPLLYAGNRGPASSLAALREWLRARWDGITEGRRRAAAEGYLNVNVYHAPEISSIRDLHAAGFASVLTDVIPFVSFDFVSYSSWESLNRQGAGEHLADDLATIRRTAGTDLVIIGEFGYATAHHGQTSVAKMRSAILTAARERVQYVFHWVLYDDSTAAGYGVFDTNGDLTAVGAFLKESHFRPVSESKAH